MADSGVVDIELTSICFINQLAIVIRTARIHKKENYAFTNAAQKFIAIINDMIRAEHEINFQLRGDLFYLNNQRVHYSPKYLLNFDYLAGQIKKIKLGTIIFKNEIDLEDIKTMIQSLIKTDGMNESFEEFEQRVADISSIEVKRIENIATDETMDAKKIARKTYFSAVMYIKGVMHKVKAEEDVDIKKAKRIFTSVVNTITKHEQVLIGMTSIKDYDEYTYFHCTNVSILSVALGRRLGLNRKMLIDLGIASLFHDMGKIEVPHEILNKPSRLADAEWRVIKQHPAWGVKAILKMRDIDELMIQSSIVAFEHHMNLNHSGYPILKNPTDLDLFTRIVSIADRYDAMTSSRVYAKTPLIEDKALSVLMERSGEELDPVLVKYFINMVGIYPIGTLVKLDTDEQGLVFENNDLDLFRPRVILITDAKGEWIEGQVVDLNEKNELNEYRRTITKIMDPKKHGINTAEYLL